MSGTQRSREATEVFVSYRVRETSTVAALIQRALVERHLAAFVDFDRLRPGYVWLDEVTEALEAPQLAVGIIVVDDTWFTSFKADLEDDVVWKEVNALRHRRESDRITIIPVYVREPGRTDRRFPSAPPDLRPEIEELHGWLDDFESFLLEPRGDHSVDQLASEVAWWVRSRSLDRHVFRSLRAAEVPPQPLVRVGRDLVLRQGLRHFAETFDDVERDVQTLTILGQDALASHDFREAETRLDHAWRLASSRSLTSPRGRHETVAWLTHAANLYVIAALHGNRPRRLRLATAGRLLRRVLEPSLLLQTDGADPWLPGTDEESRLWYECRASLAQMTLLLINLLSQDYFFGRNVRPPTVPKERTRQIADAALTLRHRLGGSGGTWVADELSHLLDEDYLDGLAATSPEIRRLRELDEMEVGA